MSFFCAWRVPSENRDNSLAQKKIFNHNHRNRFIEVMPIMNSSQSRLALLSASLIAFWMIAGCSSAPVTPKPTEDPASVSIKESLARSAGDLNFTKSSQANPTPAALAGPTVSMTYAGDAKHLLAKVAAANNLKFTILGPQPHLPLFVSVNVSNVPLEVFLRDVAEQFGQRAALALTQTSLEIRYRGNSTSK